MAAQAATSGLMPDLTLFLDVPVEVGLARVGRRGGPDRLESEALEFHERVRAGYAELMEQEPSRWMRIDASGSSQAVAQRVRAALESRGVLVMASDGRAG